MSAKMEPCCAHTHDSYFDLNVKYLAQNLTEKKCFFCKIHVM